MLTFYNDIHLKNYRSILRPPPLFFTVNMTCPLYFWLPYFCRLMSKSWMLRSGRSCVISPMALLLNLLHFPPLGSHLLLLLNGPFITWAPPLLHLISLLQLNQPGLKLTPQATPLIWRYIVIIRWAVVWTILVTFFFLLVWGVFSTVDLQSKNTMSKTATSAFGDRSKVDCSMAALGTFIFWKQLFETKGILTPVRPPSWSEITAYVGLSVHVGSMVTWKISEVPTYILVYGYI